MESLSVIEALGFDSLESGANKNCYVSYLPDKFQPRLEKMSPRNRAELWEAIKLPKDEVNCLEEEAKANSSLLEDELMDGFVTNVHH